MGGFYESSLAGAMLFMLTFHWLTLSTWSHLIVRVWKHCPTVFFWPISPPSPYKEVIVLADLETIFFTSYLHYVYFFPRKSVLCSEWSVQFLTSRISYCNNNNKTQLLLLPSKPCMVENVPASQTPSHALLASKQLAALTPYGSWNNRTSSCLDRFF